MFKINSLEKIKKNAIYIICILSFFTAFLYNQINLHFLPEDYKRDNQTVITNDDASYLNPPTNYLANDKWWEDYWGAKAGYFIRPPGYGLVYLIPFKFFDYTNAIKLVKFFQLILFSISVYWFFYISLSVLKNKKLALMLSALYGLSPFAVGFLFYTLTEGITPALLLGFVFLLFKAYNSTSQKKNIYYLLASLLFSYLFIVRPVLGIFGLLLPVFLVKDYYKKGFMHLAFRLIFFGLIALSLMITWQIRNYKIAGEYVGLHPVYYADCNETFRPPFREYWNFAGGWAERGDVGFSYMCPMWEAAITGDTSISYVNDALDNFPEDVVDYFGRARLTNVLRKYQEAVLVQKTYYDKELPMPIVQPAVEKESTEEFMQLTKEFKSEFWFQYYILSPLKVYYLMTFHSNLSLFVFQQTFRGAFVMESLRLIFFSIHGLCFLVLILNFFIIKKNILAYFTLVVTPFMYVFYLCYVQRGIEERYTLPVLPLVLIGLAYGVNYFLVILQKKYNLKLLD